MKKFFGTLLNTLVVAMVSLVLLGLIFGADRITTGLVVIVLLTSASTQLMFWVIDKKKGKG